STSARSLPPRVKPQSLTSGPAQNLRSLAASSTSRLKSTLFARSR
ncbi:hypothetical protein CFC21_097543, partial [Triticum aestivum]